MAAASNGRSSTTTTTTQQLQQRQHRQQEASSRWHPQPQQQPRRGSNETLHFVPGPAPAKHNKAPAGESWFVNASGRFVASATKGSAAAAFAAAASSGRAAGPPAAGGSGSPIITALRVQATPENILPVPMVVATSSGSGGGGGGTAPEINAKCPECQDLVKARLDEPTLMSEDRHRWEDGAFGAGDCASETLESGGGGEQAAAEEEAGSTARRAASAWRLRELTRTFNVGIILCLNFGRK
ncbi:hypothetical protein Esi_0122_0029 [Ectocarpus siliculosus]|uniref:Uncharacterized protein n=1 Tax=Ectocarpus siliculosus TaxID=2880 RepID=D7FIL5_ECTSI|nr:hypothetical protein Esi_0122_0029 [Ectocarpus siliculosus]|eukprot:CBJ28833.1 hypothetical protein Esi_0122_0029 [Ectocarpus siliculosus]